MSEPKSDIDTRGNPQIHDPQARGHSYLDIEELFVNILPPEAPYIPPTRSEVLASDLKRLVKQLNEMCLEARQQGMQVTISALDPAIDPAGASDRFFLLEVHHRVPLDDCKKTFGNMNQQTYEPEA